MSQVVTMKQLLEAGVHFGHQTRRWNPKMKPFIFQERNGIYILDLQQTLKRLLEAHEYVMNEVHAGKKIIFVGTKKQASEAVREEAERCGMYFINQRWLGGLLTNFATLSTRIKRLGELEGMIESGEMDKLPKKEAKMLRTELQKLQKYLGGVRGMTSLPEIMIIIDLRKEQNAFTEAKKAGLKVVGLVDTNCDPTGVDYPIPGNDDAIRAVKLICRVMADAVEAGSKAANITEEDFQKEAEGGEGEGAAAAPAAPAAQDDSDEIDREIDRDTERVFKRE